MGWSLHAVEKYCTQDNESQHNLLPLTLQTDQIHAISDDRQDERSKKHSPHCAATTGERSAADNLFVPPLALLVPRLRTKEVRTIEVPLTKRSQPKQD
ncbi:hypothetical protein NA78x_002711 [Anatilimnocola sp. NA78]|uniref:hypothetical protein n=1 Tax=Anatilimnocola sp. NA78 TaxID=3415683 RepID=UPI003CE4C0BC